MNPMSIIPSPVAAEVSGIGSFFGSCQIAAGNFESILQSAAASGFGTSVSQFAQGNTQPANLEFPLKLAFEDFSKFIENYSKNEVLANLQEILGEDAGAEAFEDIIDLLEKHDFSMQDMQKELDNPEILEAIQALADLQKTLDPKYISVTPIEVLKVKLEKCIEDVKEVFGINQEPEEEPETEMLAGEDAISPSRALFAEQKNEEKTYIKRLAIEMGYTTEEEFEKIEVALSELLATGLLTLQDLKDAVNIPQAAQAPDLAGEAEAPIREVLEVLWENIKDEEEPKEKVIPIFKEIKNAFKENVKETEYAERPIETEKLGTIKTSETAEPEKLVTIKTSEPVEISETPEKIDAPKNTDVKEDVEVDEKPVKAETELPFLVKIKNNEVLTLMDNERLEKFLKQVGDVSLNSGSDFSGSSKAVLGLSDIQEKFLLLLKKFRDGSLTEEEKEELKELIEKRLNTRTADAGKEREIEEEDYSPEDEESEENLLPRNRFNRREDFILSHLHSKPKANTANAAKATDINVNINFEPKVESKGHRGFKQPVQPMQTTQQPAQILQQTQAMQQQSAQTTQVEVRAVWEGGELKIETFNPQTGEKVQTTHSEMPQKMQERIQEFEIIKQVVAQAKFITTPTGEQKLTLRLNPEHLGSVDMRITLNNGEMQISARVDTQMARQALETQIGLLREGLEKQGINLERLEVSVEQREKNDAYSLAERNEHNEQRRGNRRHHHRGREHHLAVSIARDENSDTGRRLGYNTMEYLA